MAKKTKRKRRYPWAQWSDARLLETRFCDLGLTIEGSWLEEPIASLLDELEQRELRLKPHFWLGEEWFTPQGIPGICIPFYLAHPRLLKLERKQMLEAEGTNLKWCMKLLRHETGHAIQNAFEPHRRKKWRQIFGSSSKPYPEAYRPRPSSRNYVLHLYLWYAQSHPDEDFAETFAVWLAPRSQWKKRYAGWPALKKLRYVDELMHELAGKKPKVRSRRHIESVRSLKKTLGEYYDEKHSKYSNLSFDFYDYDLRRLFSDSPRHKNKESASAFLRRHRREIRQTVSRWTGETQYTLDRVFGDMIFRCRELKLRAVGTERQLKLDFAILLTLRATQYLYNAKEWHLL